MCIQVVSLGHIVSSKGIGVDTKKDRCGQGLAQTINSYRYYKPFGLGRHCFSIDNIDSKFVWPEVCEKSFKELKDRLTYAPMQTLSEGTDEFVIYIVTLLEWVSDVFMKHGKVMNYASSKLKLHEKIIQLIISNQWWWCFL